jgi:tRNA A-37 threonylcarbamoyl transferase component Bud32
VIDGSQDLVGQEVSDGRYRIFAKLGEGSMGQVYLAFDNHLQTDVVIKFPARGETLQDENHLLQRFEREIRSLVRLSHPHIVKIIDVGTLNSSPFVVLQYLSGGTLKDRLESGPSGEPRPLPPSTLHEWLLDVAKALDFIHFQGHIHRDVKPANIFFDSHGNVFLGDFGIIKILRTDESLGSWRHSSLTAPGFLLGTPSYVAPEIVMGYSGDGRSDQYSLALTVYEMLTGYNIMAGPTASATLVNQTTLDPPLLDTLVPRISRNLSETIRRGLGKDPDLRYPTCLAFAKEVLDHIPATYTTSPAGEPHDSAPGLLPCPTCRGPITLAGVSLGQQVRCERCQGLSVLRRGDEGLRLLPAAGDATPPSPPKPVGPWTSGSGRVRVVPDIPGDGSSAAASPLREPKRDPQKRRALTSRRLFLGALALTLCGAGAWLALERGTFLFGLSRSARSGDADDAATDGGQVGAIGAPGTPHNAKKPPLQDPSHDAETDEQAPSEGVVDLRPITITIAYGTEKKDWLKKAKEEFAKTPQGKRYDIDLLPWVRRKRPTLSSRGHLGTRRFTSGRRPVVLFLKTFKFDGSIATRTLPNPSMIAGLLRPRLLSF